MAVFNGHTVTLQGAKLLSRSLAGEGKFIFTKGAFGAGKYTGDITTLEKLIDKKLDLPLSDITYYEGAAVLNLQISNKTVEESFYTNELGIYAKLEGDQEEILFSYATAIKPDAIPDNSLSVTFEGEYEVYIKLTTGEKVGIEVNDNNVYITFKTGNREYVRTGCRIIGLLSIQNELVENGQYQADTGKWYLNTGGERTWNRSGIPDEKLKEITFFQHEKDINELYSEINKKATPSQLGRIMIGDNLTVDGRGRVSAIKYTHPSGNGNSHIPVNGSIGQFIKWVSSGVGQWAQITWNDITGIFPASNHKHNTLRIRNGFNYIEYDGSTSQEINIQVDGGTPGAHAHSTNDIAYLSGYNKGTYSGALTTTDSLNRALAKLENNLDGKASLEELTNKANLNHSHSSHNVAYMTGYSKAGSYSQINAYDSLNVAIGKLEKGLEEKANADMLASKADTNHSHGSNNITYMTGYSKDYSGGAISPSDSLNKAVGKLEKNLDNKADLDHTHSQYATSEDVSASLNNKYDKTGGTISGNVVVTGNEVVNGSVSCNSIILNGYTITIE